MSDFSAESNTAQGGPGPFAPLQDDDLRGPATPASPSTLPGAGTGNGSPGNGTLPARVGASAGVAGGAVTSSFASTGPAAGPQRLGPVVKGRIEVADEVVEKVAGLAVMEVEGVADLGGDFERALESVRERIGIGQKRGDQGIKARITGREVSLDVVIMVEYGHVVMEVARNVQANVAIQTNRMLGLSVVEVNVTVDDVRLPVPEKPEQDQPGEGEPAYDGYAASAEPYSG